MKIPSRGTLKARWFWVKSYIGLCLWFLQLAWKALRGKIIIVDTKITESTGGFKYFTAHISKRPLSKDHDYSKW